MFRKLRDENTPLQEIYLPAALTTRVELRRACAVAVATSDA